MKFVVRIKITELGQKGLKINEYLLYEGTEVSEAINLLIKQGK